MLTVALTGGIGSGKTTVANLFAELQVPIIDADIIARELVMPGQPALATICSTFGEEILNHDGTLNRSLLRKKIFNDTAQREQLEAILHPLIRQEMANRLQHMQADYVILVIPLLVENQRWSIIDRVLVINIDKNTQVQRVMQRDNATSDEAEAIIAAQASAQDRLAAADDIINNFEDVATLKEQVNKLHEFYMNHVAEQTNTTANVVDLASASNTSPAVTQHIYEQPLNERIRTFLRLEHLFTQADHHIQHLTQHDAHSFISALIDINSLTARGDLKSELIKELERQTTLLKRHINNADIDQSKLSGLLEQQNTLLNKLYQKEDALGQHLKEDLLFNSIKQRLSIPGGTCDFDLPVYSYWLNLPEERRIETLTAWLAPYKTIHAAIASSLDTIRNCALPNPKLAEGGYYEQATDSGCEIQMIRVLVDQRYPYYPTISAGKLRLSIRFMEWVPGHLRSSQTTEDVTFGLMVCGF